MTNLARIVVGMTLVISLIVACNPDSPQEPPDQPTIPEDMPDDFHLRSDFFGQALAPKYHYDYFIILDRVTTDSISFHPDYIENSPPLWIETFNATDADLEDLWDLMVEEDIFRDDWLRVEDTLFGAWTRALEITAQDEYYTVPIWVQDTASVNPVYARVDCLVPSTVWDSLWTWRDRYISGDSSLAGDDIGGNEIDPTLR